MSILCTETYGAPVTRPMPQLQQAAGGSSRPHGNSGREHLNSRATDRRQSFSMPPKHNTSVNLPWEVYEWMRDRDRSITSQVTEAVEQYKEREQSDEKEVEA
jgi:hypothetical protein